MQKARTAKRHSRIFRYNGQSIQYCYWTSPGQAELDTIIFLGTGQTGSIPKWVASQCPSGVAVVAGAPHWKADASGKDLKDFTIAYTRTSFDRVFADHQLKHVSTIAISQAAPGVIWAAPSRAAQIKALCLIAPLGLTTEFFGGSDAARMRELKRRAYRNFRQLKQSPLYSPRNLYSFLLLIGVRMREAERGASDRKYAEGLSYTIVKDCYQLARQLPFYLFLGARDVIFPPNEVHAALERAGKHDIKTTVLPLSHPTFIARREAKLLRQIIAKVRAEAN
ncbi:MAG TPA: hypothetical protein VLG11_00485 [Candidatus Saccharimonadales bacterium]|nr:hypothetical protein [Candidatus Saccharimonadales bacterium]